MHPLNQYLCMLIYVQKSLRYWIYHGEQEKGGLASKPLLFIYLLIYWPCHVGSYFPNQGSNPGPMHWKHRFLTIGPPGKSLSLFLNSQQDLFTVSLTALALGTPWYILIQLFQCVIPGPGPCPFFTHSGERCELRVVWLPLKSFCCPPPLLRAGTWRCQGWGAATPPVVI